jgi:UDP-N-acetylglucosamine 2-epimerase (non-hydrolysing)
MRLQDTPGVESGVCVTAQHRQMLDPVLELFHIQPDFDLDIMRDEQTLPELTSSVFSDLDPVLLQWEPDWVLIQGDTTTAMAAAILAFYRRLHVGHVEAGLRTGDKWHPFPEEINRRLVSVSADLHFAPTQWAADNLRKEGLPQGRIHVTGNTVIDALLGISAKPFSWSESELASVSRDKRIVLITAHRRESFGKPLARVFEAVKTLAGRFRDSVTIVYPVHLNPNVNKPAHDWLGNEANVHLMGPLDYLPMVHLMKAAHLILTDSGGIQEEAPSLGVPVLVLRDKTERPEAIEAGTARLVGTDPQKIVEEASFLLENEAAHSSMAKVANPFGDGMAADRIVGLLQRSLA